MTGHDVMGQDTHQDQMRVGADLVAIRSIGPWLKQLLVDHESLVPGLELALQELAVNVIEHGYGGVSDSDGANEITVIGTVTATEITIRLIDGAPALSGSITDQAGRSEAGDVTVGGFGLMIIEQVTDQFDHTPISPTGNEWTLICRL